MKISLSIVFSACCIALARLKPAEAASKRVIGGTAVSRGESPFLVTLQQIDFEKRTAVHICGASLIGGRFLLTAAHCVEDILDEPERLKAIIGTLRSGSNNTHENHTHHEDTDEFRNISSIIAEGLLQGRRLGDLVNKDDDDNEDGQNQAAEEEEVESNQGDRRKKRSKVTEKRRDNEDRSEEEKTYDLVLRLLGDTELEFESCIKKIVVHELYNNETVENDVAVLVMAMEVPQKFMSHVTPIWLPTKYMEREEYPEPGTDCTFYGWGMAHIPQDADKGFSEDSEPFAQKVDLTVRNDSFCKVLREFSPADSYDSDIMFCAGNIGVEEHKGVYKGDSGGPLVCQYGDRHYQAGIASFTSLFGAYLPAFFVRVTAYEDWIKNVMWENS